MGNLVLNGATSGSTTVQPTDAVTAVITLPSTSGTLAVSGGSPSFSTITTTNDASISGLTVGKGGGSTSTNTVVGNGALAATSSGGGTSAFGYLALAANTSGAANSAYGYQALNANTTGQTNTGIGYASLNVNTTGSSNTGIGYQALVANTTASNLTAVGYQGLYQNTTGTGNSSLGYQAGYSITTGGDNTCIGKGAGSSSTTTFNNTAVGSRAIEAASGTGNTAVGYAAGASITSSTGYNTCIGALSGPCGTGTTANSITAVGYQALTASTASGNTALGYQAGNNITTGGYNIYIGPQAIGSASNVNQEIVLGTNYTSSIAGKGSNTGYIYPNGGGVYQGNNSAAWSVTSDQRLKKNIVDNKTGLEAITKIQVRNFEYRTADEVTDLPKSQAIDIKGVQLGAIAQEIQAILPECVKTESTGVMSVDTTNLTWYLINAVKELKATVDAQAARIAVLEGAK